MLLHKRYLHVVLACLFCMCYLILEQRATGTITQGLIHEIAALILPGLIYLVYRTKKPVSIGFIAPVVILLAVIIVTGHSGEEYSTLTMYLLAGLGAVLYLSIIDNLFNRGYELSPTVLAGVGMVFIVGFISTWVNNPAPMASRYIAVGLYAMTVVVVELLIIMIEDKYS